MALIALLSASDHDLLTALSSDVDFALGNLEGPNILKDLPFLLGDCDAAIISIGANHQFWPQVLDVVHRHRIPLVALATDTGDADRLVTRSGLPAALAGQVAVHLASQDPGRFATVHALISSALPQRTLLPHGGQR